MAKKNPDIDWAVRALAERQKTYELMRDYYDGNHTLGFATEKFLNAFGYLFSTLAENLCPAVVNALRDRLKLANFTAANKRDQKAVADVWDENKLKLRAGRIHLNALKYGDTFLIVWEHPETGRPVMHPNSPLHVCVEYDTETPGRITKAARRWRRGDGRTRINLYYPDRVEKYVGGAARTTVESATTTTAVSEIGAGSYALYTGDNDSGIIPNPYNQTPVFHFANDADIGELGRSELKDVVPLQDALNKELADMLVASEFTAMPQRWATGIELPVDPETGKTDYKFTLDRLWNVEQTDVKFGEFSGSDLTPFITIQREIIEKIARVSGTPIHHFISSGGTPPSGESLKTLDARLEAKSYDRIVSFGDVWESAMDFALRIANRPGARVTANWENTQPRDEAQSILNAVMKTEKLAFSKRQVVKELGYSDDEIDADKIIREQEKAEEPEPVVAPVIARQNGGAEVIG